MSLVGLLIFSIVFYIGLKIVSAIGAIVLTFTFIALFAAIGYFLFQRGRNS